jgi:putative ABC transport system permease protein
LEGRFLDRRDAPGGLKTAVVNQSFAHRFFPNGDALGNRIRFVGNQDWLTIAGIAADAKQGLTTEVMPEIFTADLQGNWDMTVVIRTIGDPTQMIPAVRAQVAAMDKNLPLYGVETLDEMVSGIVAPQKFNALLLGAFAGLAVLLAAVGIYGVMAYTVGQRTHEIGIRMALGAAPGDVQRMVLAQGMKLALAGIVLGLAASYSLTHVLRTLLFGVTTTDSATFVGVTIILFAVALTACWIPARRATRVDPIVALRYE